MGFVRGHSQLLVLVAGRASLPGRASRPGGARRPRLIEVVHDDSGLCRRRLEVRRKRADWCLKVRGTDKGSASSVDTCTSASWHTRDLTDEKVRAS
jgi:hypothetical protein